MFIAKKGMRMAAPIGRRNSNPHTHETHTFGPDLGNRSGIEQLRIAPSSAYGLDPNDHGDRPYDGKPGHDDDGRSHDLPHPGTAFGDDHGNHDRALGLRVLQAGHQMNPPEQPGGGKVPHRVFLVQM